MLVQSSYLLSPYSTNNRFLYPCSSPIIYTPMYLWSHFRYCFSRINFISHITTASAFYSYHSTYRNYFCFPPSNWYIRVTTALLVFITQCIYLYHHVSPFATLLFNIHKGKYSSTCSFECIFLCSLLCNLSVRLDTTRLSPF